MSIFDGLETIVEEKFPLAKLSWYGLGGPADYFVRPENVDQLADVINRCTEKKVPFRVMGFGSNLLISDNGVRGAVIQLNNGTFCQTEFDNNTVTAWAGAQISNLTLVCVQKGLSGLEALTGIPGSLGGAIRMNAGGNFGDIGSVVEKVTLMDNSGQIFEKTKPELAFDYRKVNITAPLILNAELQLIESDEQQVMRTVKEIWIYKKNTQPLNTRNCGCIFKNPRGLSAGALIDRAGLKGEKVGGASVSDKHANFIVAEKNCKSSDVRELIRKIREQVSQQFDIELELEIEIWD